MHVQRCKQSAGMKLFLIVLCAAAAAAEVPLYYHESIGVPAAARIKLAEENAVEGERIVGGWDAPLGAYPYMGGLVITLSSGATSICGAALVTNTRAVTAAHCWWDGRNHARQLTVVLGSLRLFTGGVRINTSDVEMHTNWTPSTLNSNIAIIRFPFVNSTTLIQPVRMPADVAQGNNNFANRWGIAIGFGRTSDFDGITPYQYLSRVNMQIITNVVCQQTFGNFIITASTICTSGAGGVGTCGGDSGSPLVVVTDNQHVLVGVASFALCQKALPSAFTRVTSFEAWIRQRF